MEQRVDRLLEWKSVLKAIVREVETEFGVYPAIPITLGLTRAIDSIYAELRKTYPDKRKWGQRA